MISWWLVFIPVPLNCSYIFLGLNILLAVAHNYNAEKFGDSISRFSVQLGITLCYFWTVKYCVGVDDNLFGNLWFKSKKWHATSDIINLCAVQILLFIHCQKTFLFCNLKPKVNIFSFI